MQTGLKKCPQCGAMAYMDAPSCQNCGRVYQSTNPANLNKTQVFSGQQPIAPSGVASKKRVNLWWLLTIPVGFCFVLMMFSWISHAGDPRIPEAPAAHVPTKAEFRRAVPLYSRSNDVIAKFGEPGHVSSFNSTETWYYRLADGGVAIDVQYGQVMNIATD